MNPLLLIAGAWKANLGKSQRDPNHQFQSLTLHFDISGEAVLLTFTGVNRAGEDVSGTRKLRLDGKEYPVAEAPSVMESSRWTGPNTLETVYRQDGTVVSEGSYEVAKDGKTLTSKGTGINESGTPFEQVIVFDRE